MLTPLLKVVSVLVLCLLALQTWALSGPETAQLLNQRLLATPEQCVDDSPTYNCSGVLLLPMSDSHPRPF